MKEEVKGRGLARQLPTCIFIETGCYLCFKYLAMAIVYPFLGKRKLATHFGSGVLRFGVAIKGK